MNMSIKAEFLAGTDIEDAAREACRVAAQLGVNIVFDFNEVHCVAQPGGDPEQLVGEFRKAIRSKSRYPMAFARAPG